MSANDSTPDLLDPATMLDTLHAAYQLLLDNLGASAPNARLTLTQERELGAQLARYWTIRQVPKSAQQPHQRRVSAKVIDRTIASIDAMADRGKEHYGTRVCPEVDISPTAPIDQQIAYVQGFWYGWSSCLHAPKDADTTVAIPSPSHD